MVSYGGRNLRLRKDSTEALCDNWFSLPFRLQQERLMRQTSVTMRTILTGLAVVFGLFLIVSV